MGRKTGPEVEPPFLKKGNEHVAVVQLPRFANRLPSAAFQSEPGRDISIRFLWKPIRHDGDEAKASAGRASPETTAR